MKLEYSKELKKLGKEIGKFDICSKLRVSISTTKTEIQVKDFKDMHVLLDKAAELQEFHREETKESMLEPDYKNPLYMKLILSQLFSIEFIIKLLQRTPDCCFPESRPKKTDIEEYQKEMNGQALELVTVCNALFVNEK